MYSLKIQNEWNNTINLTNNEDMWQITSVTGLNAPPAIISTSTVAGFDGSRFNSSRLDNRNIVISLAFDGNVDQNIRIMNAAIMPKRYVKVFYKNKQKDLYIEGYVESFEYDHFSNKVLGQISIICPSPYWMDVSVENNIFSPIVDLFEFPFSLPVEGISLSEIVQTPTSAVINYGNVETGVEIEIEALHNIIQPSVMNLTTGETITLETELQGGDRILISTIKGDKYIKEDCNCIESNIINSLTDDSAWIHLLPGENRFTFSALYGVENMTMTVKHRDLYGGV